MYTNKQNNQHKEKIFLFHMVHNFNIYASGIDNV